MKRRIAIAGNGAWGQALAHVASSAGHEVKIWSRQKPNLVELFAAPLTVVQPS